jgi:hypothetical protein
MNGVAHGHEKTPPHSFWWRQTHYRANSKVLRQLLPYHIFLAGSLGSRTLRALSPPLTGKLASSWIEQAHLHQHARLIPIDVLM